MKSPLVSIIIPVWFDDESGYQMTKRCIDSILQTDYDNFELIIVDDASPYNKFHELRKQYIGCSVPMVFTRREENGGSTRAFNKGLEAARGDFIQYQNNDTEFPNTNWLRNQMQYFNDEVGVVGCMMLYPNGTIQHAGAAWIDQDSRYIGHIGMHELEVWHFNDVPFVTGCGMTVRREILERNNGLTVFEGYGWDDIDIQVKAKKWGYMIKIAQDAVFTHFGSYSYSKRPDLATVEAMNNNSQLFEDVEVPFEDTIEYYKQHYYIN